MRRRFLGLPALALAALLATQLPARAAVAENSLAKSTVLEGNVAYLRVGRVGSNLVDEVRAAQSALAVSNKIAGTVLDLRFADGDDADTAKAAAAWLTSNKSPVAILINSETHGAAVTLAEDLREAHAGLIFGGSTNIKPDIAVSVPIEDEKKFLENPFGTLSEAGGITSEATNTLLPFVDHTSEADLVRERLRSGSPGETSQVAPAAGPPKSFIQDPVLARGVDFITGLALLNPTRNEADGKKGR